MKKALFSVLYLIFAMAAFAAETMPAAVIKIAPPHIFTKSLDDFIRAVAPETSVQTQMIIAMSMAQFGYPFFDGVDRAENAVVAIFDNSTGKPDVLAAIKADPAVAAVCKNAAAQQGQYLVKNGWFAVNMSGKLDAAKFEALANATIECTEEKSPYSFSISFYPERTGIKIPKDSLKLKNEDSAKIALACLENFSDLFKQMKKLELALNIGSDGVASKMTVSAKDGSKMAEVFNMLPKRAKIRGLGAMNTDALYVAMGSIDTARATDPLLDMLMPMIKNFMEISQQQEEAIRVYSKKCGTTWAGYMNFNLGNEISPEIVNVTQTSLSYDDMEKYNNSVFPLKLKIPSESGISETNLKQSCQRVKISGMEALKFTTTWDPKINGVDKSDVTYVLIKDGLLVQASSEDLLVKAAEKLSEQNPALSRFEKTDNDATMILNLGKILPTQGINLGKQEIPPLVLFAKFKKNAAEAFTRMDAGTISKLYKIFSALPKPGAANQAPKGQQGAPQDQSL